MTISAVVLCHPQSVNLLPDNTFNSNLVRCHKIACGTTKVDCANLSESNDFFPTYASLNSILFETSVILTVWEHYDELIGDDSIAILHSDITPRYDSSILWSKLENWLGDNSNRAIGLTVNRNLEQFVVGDQLSNSSFYIPQNDPMHKHDFDCSISVWDYVKDLDYQIYCWAMDTQPLLIYSHQFCCSKKTFNILGAKLMDAVNRLKFGDCGLWTPHVFERLIALYLAYIGGPYFIDMFLASFI